MDAAGMQVRRLSLLQMWDGNGLRERVSPSLTPSSHQLLTWRLTSCLSLLPQSGHSLQRQIAWADAFVVAYSICDVDSFAYAVRLLETIRVLRTAIRPPVLLLANKKDLEHVRQVSGC